MIRDLRGNLRGAVVCLVVFMLGSAVSAPGAARFRPAEPGLGVEKVGEYDFDSYEALLEWLQGVTDDGEALEDVLGGIEEELQATVCMSPLTTPSVVNARKPFRFKVIQLQLRVGVGDCGLIICSVIAFSMEWFIAPSSGGAFIFGPSPGRSRGQVCQGQSTSTQGFLILLGSVDNGVYSLNFVAVGFGGITVKGGVQVNVSGP